MTEKLICVLLMGIGIGFLFGIWYERIYQNNEMRKLRMTVRLLRQLHHEACDRIHAQSEILAKHAEKKS